MRQESLSMLKLGYQTPRLSGRRGTGVGSRRRGLGGGTSRDRALKSTTLFARDARPDFGRVNAMLRLIALALILISSASAEVRAWSARWISVAGAPPTAYGVYHFRRTFDLAAVPAAFPIHVTADNRYILFVNGKRAVWGPAYGDLMHWRYETIDIAPFLVPGKNTLAAVVWNYGEHAGLTQNTDSTGFLLQGEGAVGETVNTGKSWRASQDSAYQPLPVDGASIRWQYYVAPPGERFDASLHPWGWESPGFDDSSWKEPAVHDFGCSLYWTKDEVPSDCHDRRTLVPRPIPPMEYTQQELPSFKPVSIGAHTQRRILLDQGRVTTAYPEFTMSAGAGTRVTITYAESLWEPGSNRKGDRAQVEGKEMRGLKDVLLLDGKGPRTFRPLWWRTFRYIELNVETGDQPVSIDAAQSWFTAYPFVRKARFEGGEPWIRQVLDTGWWGNRLSANEIWQDAYYEQMQYVADTRIESLVSLFESGDARLMRNAIEQFDSTRTPDGLTYSRAPSRLYQYTPTFSLLWIGMVHDYWRYVDDPDFVRAMLPGVRAVLGWYQRLQRPDGLLTKLPWYNFLDSNVRWQPDTLGHYELQLLQAFQWASDLTGDPQYKRAAEQLRASIRRVYWDSSRRYFASDTAHTYFLQHTQALAVLTGVSQGDEARDLMERTLADKSLVPTTIYFSYYLHEAAIRAGLGDRYLGLLSRWRELLKLHVTAWPEVDAPEARSDCHGWGDHPNIEMYRTVLGIDSAAPAFARVVIEPRLGTLTAASGSIPHPKGTIAVTYKLEGGHIEARIETPVDGEFVWQGSRTQLRPGVSTLRF